jgi:uncharacterized protein with ATP-grasp and redox domains
VVNAIATMIPELPLGLKPPEIAQQGYRLIGEITGNNDPFQQAKVEANRAVLAIYPHLQQLVDLSADLIIAKGQGN